MRMPADEHMHFSSHNYIDLQKTEPTKTMHCNSTDNSKFNRQQDIKRCFHTHLEDLKQHPVHRVRLTIPGFGRKLG